MRLFRTLEAISCDALVEAAPDPRPIYDDNRPVAEVARTTTEPAFAAEDP